MTALCFMMAIVGGIYVRYCMYIFGLYLTTVHNGAV